jgi:signal transduction histidine kinase
MARALGLALGATLAVAAGYGALWLIASWGLVVVGAFGGWLIGVAVARGLAGQHSSSTWPRGASTVAAALGMFAWLLGTYVAFTIVQLFEGSGALLDRLGPSHFMANLAAIADPPWMQLAILAAFGLGAAYGARAPRAGVGASEGG